MKLSDIKNKKMRFSNISLDRNSTNSSVRVKDVRSKRKLKKSLLPGKNEVMLRKGPYIKFKVKYDGSEQNIRVPFFLASKSGEKFIDLSGVNKVNPLAYKILLADAKINGSKFDDTDLEQYKTEEETHLQSLIDASSDADEIAELTAKKTSIHNLKRSDSRTVLKRIKALLEQELEQGLDLSVVPDADKPTEIAEYCKGYELLALCESQLKKLTWSQKRGLSKLNNKFVKGFIAIALAGTLVVTSYTTRLFGLIPKKDSKPKNKQVSMYNKPSEEEYLTIGDTTKEESQVTTSKYKTNGDNFENWYTANVTKFSNESLIKTVESIYHENISKMIKAYTMIEHIDQLNLTESELKDAILNTKRLISCDIQSGNGVFEKELIRIIGGTNSSNPRNLELAFQYFESKPELLNMLIAGEVIDYYLPGETIVLNGKSVSSSTFFQEYRKMVEDYIKAYQSGTLLSVNGPAKTLGTYPTI